MHCRRSRRARAAFVRVALAASCAIALPALAATPIKVTSKAATDGPIHYTVKVTSKQFGNASETRTLRSGDTDDFTWRTTPPGGAVPAPEGCPDLATLPLDANGAMVRQTQVRLTPVVDEHGTANVQLNFRAQTPHGTRSVTSGEKTLKCPDVKSYSQIVHFSMATNGTPKMITLSDGTQLTISAQR
ncbi:DUF6013 family protein [Paraburkholderia adhaesiva]|uniref:DUF6013 family protein n=1 Tax=Paraburkholderia adhaesiva TaxID=2883244 RepID=UPI001F3A34F1|nr:DUF6013 family protein [Paraburkholderia adhaesiva]